MISVILNATSSVGAWGSEPFQAPTDGLVVGLILNNILNAAGGAGADVTQATAVFPTQPTGGGFGALTDGMAPCYAFLIGTCNEGVGSQNFIAQSIFVPTAIRMVAGQTIWLGCFCSSSVHAGGSYLVVQFQPKGQK